MELFIWLWAYDKRLLCGLKYGIHSFIYVWLVPVLTSLTVLGLTYVNQIRAKKRSYMDVTEQEACPVMSKDLQQSSDTIKRLMIIQEGILISIFFASLLSMIIADRIIKRQAKVALSVEQLHATNIKNCSGGKNEITGMLTAYDFQSRYDSVKSAPSFILLFLALANYCFSYRFKAAYGAYLLALQQAGVTSVACEIPGSHILTTYSLYLVHGIGSVILTIYACALLLKAVAMLSTLLCPICITRIKLRCKKLHVDNYEHYKDEFDFDAIEESDCEMGSSKQTEYGHVVKI